MILLSSAAIGLRIVCQSLVTTREGRSAADIPDAEPRALPEAGAIYSHTLNREDEIKLRI